MLADRMHSLVVVMALAASVLLSGCSENIMSDLERYVNAEKSKKAGRIKPVPEFKAYDSYVYVVDQNSRSPFEPMQQEEMVSNKAEVVGGGITPDSNRNRESLESFPLDTLRYVGSLERGGNIWAIIISPDSLIHKIQVGNYIGQNYGKITNISDSRVDVSELVPNGMGGWIERLAGLSLIE
ncbi:MAG: pilus assembly protein PilP [Gammaproteobacteria bacterium]|nr:pilus assembly protein PilP [Gammaproteobacteria bacterium]MCW8982822.1 pilus assembly protein PilP [Gammaproteobacteria bacterium]